MTTGTDSGIAQNLVAINCTFVGNSSTQSACFSGGASTNCIVWDNTPTDISGGTHVAALYTTSSVALTNACIQPDDARFALGRRPEAPFSMLRSSPAINAGVPVIYAEEQPLDFYGNHRIRDNIDIGCAEYWPQFDPTVIKVR